MRLEAEGDDVTVLHYTVDAQVGGKIAQLGGRLIDSTAKKLAGEFFETFAEKVSGVAPAEDAGAKPGWFAKITGTSAVVALLALMGANWCCVTGLHHHAQFISGDICSHVASADRG